MTSDDLLRVARQAIVKTVRFEGVPGLLGSTDGSTIRYTDPSGTLHNDKMWVRLGGEGGTTEAVAKAGAVPLIYDLPVRVANRDGTPTIISIDDTRISARTGGYPLETGLHAWTHYRLGPDPLYIEGLAFLPLMARPSSPPAMTVTVEQAFYRYEGTDKVWETGDSADLSSYVPSEPVVSDQHFIIICLDRVNNALAVVDGTDATSTSSDVPFTVSDVSAISIDATYYPIAAIRFYYGQTTIQVNDIFMDLRLWGGGGNHFDVNTIMTDGDGAVMADGEGNLMVES